MISDLAPFLVAGLATGSVYALAAMGLVLTYKTSGVFNFAHGALAAVGAYVTWELWQVEGWPWPLAALAALLVAGIGGGMLLERVAYGLADRPAAMRVVATVGTLVTLQGLLVIRYGSATIPMPFFLPSSTVSVLGVHVRYEQFIVFALALSAAAGLSIMLRRSRVGIAMQGVVDDPALLSLQGVSPVAVRRSAWMIGSCFAATSGALLAPTLGLDATLLTLLVVQAFGAAAIGRFDSMALTYVGGIIVGVGQELLKYVVSQDVLRDRVSDQILAPLPSNLPFLVLFVTLVVTPRGKLVERGAAIVRRERPPAPLRRPVLVGYLAALATAVVLVPYVAGTRLPTFTSAAAFAVIFASLHLLVRTSGQVSLCQMAFAAVGAAASIHLQAAGAPFLLAVLGGALVAVPVGALIAVPAVRLSGVFLAIATFGFGILVERMVFATPLMFGTDQALEVSRPAGLTSDTRYYYVVVGIAAAALGLLVVVRSGRLGRLLRGLGDSSIAVAAHGSNTTIIRTLAFCTSAFLAAVGGALLGPVTGTATGGTFNFGVSLSLLAVLLLCGRRPVLAAVLAAVTYVVVPSYISDPARLEWLPVVFGVSAVVAATDVARRAWRAWRSTARARQRESDVTPARARFLTAQEVRAT